MLRSYSLAAAGLLVGFLPAQGSVRNGIYVDSALGFQCKVPAKWRQIPTQVDERWVVVQFQSHLQYQGHAKLDGYTRGHRPMMRVIRFDKRLLSRKSDVASRSGRRAVNRLRLPYRDYRDYVRRNRKQGGFFFPVEKFDQKLGGHSVDIYEVQVDKLARGGRRHCIAYVFRGGDVDFAVEFEFLEHRFRKLKPLAMRSFLSFKRTPRAELASSLAEDEHYLAGLGGFLGYKEESASERRARREQVAQTRAKRAVKGLPRGWKATESENFTVLSSASRRHTSRLVRAAEACRKHLDDRLSSLSEEYVPNGIVRVCEDAGVYAAYRTRSSDAYSVNGREIVTYEDKRLGNGSDYGSLFHGIYSQFMADKDSLLYGYTPFWMARGMRGYFETARVRGGKMEFQVSAYEVMGFRALRQRKVAPMTPRQLMSLTRADYEATRLDDLKVSAQLLTFYRFLESSGSRHPLLRAHRGGFPLAYLRATSRVARVVEAKRKSEQRKAPSTVTEEEEEQRAEALGTAHAKRRDLVCSMVNKELCDWSDAAWDSLERAYRVFLKKHKFL